MKLQICTSVNNVIEDETGQSIATCWGSQKKKKALAKELVRRWNSQPDLLEGCKYAHILLTQNIGQSTHAIAMLEAAIAKALPHQE